jgi:hypothetical protein
MSLSLEAWNRVLAGLREVGLEGAAEAGEVGLQAARTAPLRVAVIGEVKAGKSSLIGHLLGGVDRDWLVVDVNEANARCIEVRAAALSGYRAVVAPGEAEFDQLGPSDFARWEALVRGQAPLPDGARLELGSTASWLQELGMVLVDTPGLNTTTEGLFDITWSAATSAPLVLYVLRANSGLRATDVEFLESIRTHVGSVVLVLSQLDLIGASTFTDAVALKQLKAVQDRLAASNLHPLAVVGTAAKLEDDEASGILALRDQLRRLAAQRREEVLLAATAVRVASRWRDDVGAIGLRLEAARQAERTDRQVFRQRIGELESRVILDRGAADAARRRVQLDTQRLRLQALNQLLECSERTIQEVGRAIDNTTDLPRLHAFTRGPLRNTLDGWRSASANLVEARLSELSADAARAARDAIEAQLKGIGGELGAMVPTELLDGPGEPPAGRDPKVDELQQLQRTLQALVEQLSVSLDHGDTPEGLQMAIEAAKRELDGIEYVPVYDPVVLDQGKRQLRELGRFLGNAGDIALTLAPIPTKGPLAALLAKAPGGTAAVQQYNRLLKLRDSAIVKAVGPLQEVLALPRGVGNMPGGGPRGVVTTGEALGWVRTMMSNLSLATWGERLGGVVGDMTCPDRTVEIENPEVLADYKRRIKPHADRLHALNLEYAEVERRRGRQAAELQDALTNQARIDDELRRLEQQRDQDAIAQRARLEEAQLLQAKMQLLAALEHQLLERDGGGWHATLRQGVDQAFAEAGQTLEASVVERAERGISALSAALKEAESVQTRGVAEAAEARGKLEGQLAALRAAIDWVDAA